MILQQNPDGKLELSGLGLKFEIDPRWLLTESLNKNSRVILDQLLESSLEAALLDFLNSDENNDEKRKQLYQKECRSFYIQKIADIERDLISKLHSDGECIELNEELDEIRKYAYTVWRYDSKYGYKSIQKIEMK